MYIVENLQEAEKVANLLIKEVHFVIISGVQFIAKDIESVSATRQPDDQANIIISINLIGGRYAIVNYYDFERKCHFSTSYSEVNSLIIGINDLTDDEKKDYEEMENIIEKVEETAVKTGISQ